ncbi:MAG TPA: hypothetical protein EYG89_05395, partial [Bacteroidia bacterium]|nr:hypothetical protein [Bacteroidia bacterium]
MLRLNNFNFTTFSLAFLIVGMPIVYVLREYIPISKALFTYGIIGVLLIGLIDFKNLIKIKLFNNKPKIFILILILNMFLFLFYAIGYGQLFENIQSIFIILILFIFIAFSTHVNKDFKDLLFYILIISSLTTYISLTLNTNEWMMTSRFYVGDTKNPNISSFIALVNILSITYFLYQQHKTKIIVKFIFLMTGIASLYIYLMSFSKSAILGLFFAIIFLFFIERKFILTLLKNLIFISLIIIPILIFIFPDIIEKIDKSIEMLQYAYYSYLYGQTGSMSAEIRHNNLKEMLNLLPSVELLSGNGIFTTRADQPILQIFTDLGIIPGTINFIAMF